jgi:hypothetical protein
MNRNERNGQKEYSPGDKPYKAVEYSQFYFVLNSRSSKPTQNYKINTFEHKTSNFLDHIPNKFFLDKMEDNNLTPRFKQEDYKNEIQNVRNLDEWKAALSLKTPFKVVNRDEKCNKYRPRVNR